MNKRKEKNRYYQVMARETNFTTAGGELSTLSASIVVPPSSSITMAVGGSVTLTRATPLPSEVTGNYLVSKEERVEHFSTNFAFSSSLFLSSIDL